MFDYIPIEDAPLSEVLARVVYRLIHLEWQRSARPWDYCRTDAITDIVTRLSPQFPQITTWLIACEYECRRCNLKTHIWKRNISERARRAQHNRSIGRPWKRVP